MAGNPARLRDVERELARARGARRLLPWAVATAAGGGLLAYAAGGGAGGAVAIAAAGLLFALFLWAISIARCPVCGAPLRPAAARRPESCSRCRARFE